MKAWLKVAVAVMLALSPAAVIGAQGLPQPSGSTPPGAFVPDRIVIKVKDANVMTAQAQSRQQKLQKVHTKLKAKLKREIAKKQAEAAAA